MVHICIDDNDFLGKTADRNQVFLVDFFAEWCGPCRMIAPFFEQLSRTYPDITFLKVDIDKCENTAQRFAVRAVPTFIFLKGGQQLAQVKGGGAKDALEAKCKELSQPQKQVEGAAHGMADLSVFIDKTQSECLNESDGSPLACALEDEQGELKSDCDEQLLIRVAFTQPIKLHSLRIDAGGDVEQAPKTVRIFSNVTNPLDFEDAEVADSTQDIELENGQLGKAVPVRFVKFQKVNNLTIFIKDNQGGGDVTALSRLQLIGQTNQTTNMADFKRVSGKVGERE